eukprot:CAMPEP_0114591774 /NCGR_PEP_ID=MMETSP0125-20121206/13742_1 /TAXON_ID=485358 ORGANISM="Aristerostoma sp., Strain ATCC 50986" /NCGR_SAMPLE_ID=MMETSP0125 /ASSEMBLY_ACC=CAM_ASM_000245 /LENGTH=336 /DNA_ID=CAMNT_0001790037 /DNA_START=98 /DNA_END=1108 /DNA_ORIENTATION=-
MKWWDDLWLNESFADCMAYICSSSCIENGTIDKNYKSPWSMFFLDKLWCYPQDERPTTHSVKAEVTNTEMAKLAFDGITYTKGAASLIQLYRLIGAETFSKGIDRYFQKYKWKNATFDNFIEMFKRYVKDENPDSAKNLDNWKKDWLETAGLSQIQAEWDPTNESSTAYLKIYQTSCLEEFPCNRFIKVQVALFDENGKVTEIKDAIINKSTTTIDYDGSKKPKAVFPNFGDQGYVKVKLDDDSKSFFSKNIQKIDDELTRAGIWWSLSRGVTDGEVNPLVFIESAIAGLQFEKENSLMKLIEYITEISANYLTNELRLNMSHRLFGVLIDLLLKT